MNATHRREEVTGVAEDDGCIRIQFLNRALAFIFRLHGIFPFDAQHIRVPSNDDEELPPFLRLIKNEAMPRVQMIEGAEDEDARAHFVKSTTNTCFSSNT